MWILQMRNLEGVNSDENDVVFFSESEEDVKAQALDLLIDMFVEYDVDDEYGTNELFDEVIDGYGTIVWTCYEKANWVRR